MPNSDVRTLGDDSSESPHAAQLKRGFPMLRFEPRLETEFRQVHRAESLPQIRRNLWLGIVFLLIFTLLDRIVLRPETSQTLDAIRAAAFIPLVSIAMVVVHTRWYHQWYPTVCAIAAPLFGIAAAAVAVIAARDGLSLISTIVLITIYIYFMLGMMFYAALFAAAVVFLAYAAFAVAAGLPVAPLTIDLCALAFANVIGAIVCYSLERATRTNFLEERLLKETASRDGLTGIHNRRSFDEHIGKSWTQAIRERAPVALLLIDIDYFKAYNDYYGHVAGDECLRRVAEVLGRSARRPLDITARYGGEEFAIVLYNATRAHAEDAVRRIRAGIEALAIDHAAARHPSKRLTVSIGVASIQPLAGRSWVGFVQLADEALYAAKERGRDCVVIMDKEYKDLLTGSFRKGASVEPPPLARTN
jgi:diguanylate cyclase (GGDEF)-like protein